MIPKIIHYCWFGQNEKPDLIKKCIESWKKYLPDYQIIEWNEENFDINALRFTKSAYERKKWAFVSDVARLTALIEYGGFYFDTDVEVLELDPISKFLNYKRVFVFETERRINTGLFCGCEKNDPFINTLFSSYSCIDFSDDSIYLNTTLNFPYFSSYFPELIMNNTTQIINHSLFLSMSDYSKIMQHYGTRSWLDNKVDYTIKWKDTKIRKMIRNPKIYKALEKRSYRLLNMYEFLTYDLLDMGAMYFIRRQIKIFRNKKSRSR